MILDKFREYPFISFKAPDDSLERNELWQIMSGHGFLANLNTLIRVQVFEVLTSLMTLDGSKQGDALSNLLFNIALEGAIRELDVQRNGTIKTHGHIFSLDLRTILTS